MKYLLILLLTACSVKSSHHEVAILKEEYLLIVAVDAKNFNYSDLGSYLTSLTLDEHRDVGHAWVALKGHINGMPVCLMGGHSGEFGQTAPRYLDTFYYLVKQNDPNPVSALFKIRQDGVFEEGNGGHKPTFAVAFVLNKESFQKVLKLLERDGYDFASYNLLNHHCVHFAATCLAVAGFPVEVSSWYELPQRGEIFGIPVQLWSQKEYSGFELSTPETLEWALRDQVNRRNGVIAFDALEVLTSSNKFPYTSPKEELSHASN